MKVCVNMNSIVRDSSIVCIRVWAGVGVCSVNEAFCVGQVDNRTDDPVCICVT